MKIQEDINTSLSEVTLSLVTSTSNMTTAYFFSSSETV